MADIFNANRITVIGDIHGEYGMMAEVVQRALNDERHIVFLGDLNDRGPNTPGVVDSVLTLQRYGYATVICGNHDDKMIRWAMGNQVKATHGMQETIKQFNDLNDSERSRILTDLTNYSQDWFEFVTTGGVTFAHGGFHQSMVDNFPEGLRFRDKKIAKALVSRANYGKTENPKRENADGFLVRDYSWVDDVLPGHNVVIGHDPVSFTRPVRFTGRDGGHTFFVDTGAGKGGIVSAVNADRGADGNFVFDTTNVWIEENRSRNDVVKSDYDE